MTAREWIALLFLSSPLVAWGVYAGVARIVDAVEEYRRNWLRVNWRELFEQELEDERRASEVYQ